MSTACDEALDNVGLGVSASLRAVDCVASEFSADAFGRLFASGGGLGGALTIILTLFVALFAIGLLLGRTSLSVRSITPRMMTLGLVLTFATSWVAYQSVVWNLAIGGPDWLATLVLGGDESATQTFGDKIDIVFLAVQEASGEQTDISAFSPQGLLWLGAMLFLLGTVGVLVTARIALAVLVALGPIFVVMALFDGARGLFTGWLKGVVMLALVPLFAVLGGGVMLELAIPVLSALTEIPGRIDPQPAAAFFLIGAVHVALMLMVVKVTATMVGNWTVFGLATARADLTPVPTMPASNPYAAAPASGVGVAPAAASAAPSRRIDVSAVPTPAPANDGPGTGSGGGSVEAKREVRVFATSSASAQPAAASAGPDRLSGIGSRFKPVPARVMEKTG
jgi:type IV secretion system protein VirB6